MAQQNNNTPENDHKERPIWFWLVMLIPVYLIIALPFSFWLEKKVNNSDEELIAGHTNSFSTQLPAPTTSQTTVPVPSAVPATAAVDNVAENFSMPSGFGANTQSAQPKQQAAAPADNTPKTIPETVKSWMKSFGEVIDVRVVAKAAVASPKLTEMLFNTDFVSNKVKERLQARGAWDDPQKLIELFTKTPEGRFLMTNKNIKDSMNNAEMVGAILGSKTMSQIMSSPAMKALSKNPNMLAQLAIQDPNIMSLLTNPVIASSMASNPNTAALANSLGNIKF